MLPDHVVVQPNDFIAGPERRTPPKYSLCHHGSLRAFRFPREMNYSSDVDSGHSSHNTSTERANATCGMTSCRKITLYTVGTVLLTTGFLITGFWWHIYNALVLKQLPLSNGSDSQTFDMWTKNEIPLHLRMYMFNWTNPEETLTKAVAPNLQQVGPYVYRLEIFRKNFVWNSNDTITYLTGQRYYFERELSVGDPHTDVITSPNVILITIAPHLAKTFAFVKSIVSDGLKKFGINPYVKKTVSELLFDGYDDKLLDLLKPFKKYISALKTLPSRFAWYLPKNTTMADVFNLYTGQTDLSRLGLLHARNYSTEMTGFGGLCAKVQGSPGDLWPTDITQRENASLFISDFCSSIQLDKQSEQVVNDINGMRFEGLKAAFDNGTQYPEKSCYCPNNKCQWKSGVRDVSSCVQAPLVVSFPHFYQADPSYYQTMVKGLNPDPRLHSFYMTYQKDYGIVLNGAARLQLNVHLQPIPGFGLFEHAPDTLIPALWFEEVIELPPSVMNKLHFSFTTVPLIFSVIGLLLVVLGAIMIVSTVIVTRLTEESIPYVNERL